MIIVKQKLHIVKFEDIEIENMIPVQVKISDLGGHSFVFVETSQDGTPEGFTIVGLLPKSALGTIGGILEANQLIHSKEQITITLTTI